MAYGWKVGKWNSRPRESESALFGLVSRLSQTDEERDVWMDDLKTGNCDAWMPLLLIVLSYYPWHAAPYSRSPTSTNRRGRIKPPN